MPQATTSAQLLGLNDLGDTELMRVFDWLGPQELLGHAAVVCRRWAALAHSEEAWRLRFSAADLAALRRLPELQHLPLRRLHGVFGPVNLLQNPLLLAEQQTKDHYGPLAATHPWQVTLHRGHGWVWEGGGGHGAHDDARAALPLPLPALGQQPPPAGTVPGAVASSFGWCELMQPVDLVAALCSRDYTQAQAAAVLDASPALEFSVCFGARSDCQAECEVIVVLDPGRQPLPSYVGRHTHPWDRDKIVAWDSRRMWPVPGKWHSVTAILHGYPAGVRRAIVVLRGKDRKFWAGHYGGKFAAPQLTFVSSSRVSALERASVQPVSPGVTELINDLMPDAPLPARWARRGPELPLPPDYGGIEML